MQCTVATAFPLPVGEGQGEGLNALDGNIGPRTSLARKLRRQETDTERKLWSHIRGRQFLGLKI